MFFLIGGIFLNWGHFFYNWGQMGANVLVEFENVFLIGGIYFYNWGHFFFKLGAKIILGSRKSAILGIIWTPDRRPF